MLNFLLQSTDKPEFVLCVCVCVTFVYYSRTEFLSVMGWWLLLTVGHKIGSTRYCSREDGFCPLECQAQCLALHGHGTVIRAADTVYFAPASNTCLLRTQFRVISVVLLAARCDFPFGMTFGCTVSGISISKHWIKEKNLHLFILGSICSKDQRLFFSDQDVFFCVCVCVWHLSIKSLSLKTQEQHLQIFQPSVKVHWQVLYLMDSLDLSCFVHGLLLMWLEANKA